MERAEVLLAEVVKSLPKVTGRVEIRRSKDRLNDSMWLTPTNVPPLELAPVVADWVHNLRCALDNAAFAAASSHRALSDSEARSVVWPITTAPAEWKKYSKTVGLLPPSVLAVVEGSQPYHDAFPKDDLLAAIQLIDNLAKHRALHLVVAATSASYVVTPTSRIAGCTANSGIVPPDGLEILRIEYRKAQTRPAPTLPTPDLLVVLEHAPRRYGDLTGFLAAAQARVKDLVAAAEAAT